MATVANKIMAGIYRSGVLNGVIRVSASGIVYECYKLNSISIGGNSSVSIKGGINAVKTIPFRTKSRGRVRVRIGVSNGCTSPLSFVGGGRWLQF